MNLQNQLQGYFLRRVSILLIKYCLQDNYSLKIKGVGAKCSGSHYLVLHRANTLTYKYMSYPSSFFVCGDLQVTYAQDVS